jgi:hypothetical protein
LTGGYQQWNNRKGNQDVNFVLQIKSFGFHSSSLLLNFYEFHFLVIDDPYMKIVPEKSAYCEILYKWIG